MSEALRQTTELRAIRPCDVIVLAGDRSGHSPLLEGQGVEGKALIFLDGIPLLTRVLSAVSSWPPCRSIVLVAPKTPAYQQAVALAIKGCSDVDWVEPKEYLFESLEQVLASPDRLMESGLIVTGDHGLLQADWLSEVWTSLDDQTDVAVGLADGESVMQRFPGQKRTRYQFSDQSICGGNVFAFRMPAFARLLDHWRAMEGQRKRPWRMLSLLGYGYVLRYLSGRLPMSDAFARLSTVTSTTIRPVIVPDPTIAVDIDSSSDLALAESVVANHKRSAAGSR